MVNHHDDLPASGIVDAYLAFLKDKIVRELAGNAKPVCYQNGTFWITPKDGYFAMHAAHGSSEGLTPISLYYPRVFVWSSHLHMIQPF